MLETVCIYSNFAFEIRLKWLPMKANKKLNNNHCARCNNRDTIVRLQFICILFVRVQVEVLLYSLYNNLLNIYNALIIKLCSRYGNLYLQLDN